MTERMFVLYKFKPEIERRDYESWLQREHYPWLRSLPGQQRVEGYFLNGDYENPTAGIEDLEWDAIAVIDIDDRAAWQAELDRRTDAAEQWGTWETYIVRRKIYLSEVMHA